MIKGAEIFSLKHLVKYNKMTKIEFLCEDDEKERFCKLIKNNSQTGHEEESVIVIHHAESFKL